MRGRHVLTPLLAAAILAPAALPAQTIYRCGSSYSHAPCAGGQALAPEPPLDPAQDKARKAQADAATRRDLKTAGALEKNRLKEEVALARTQRAGRGPGGYDGGNDDYDEARADPNKKYFTAHAGPPPKHRHKGKPAKEAVVAGGAPVTPAAPAKKP